MDGIKLICLGSIIETLTNESAMILHKPKRVFQYEEDNPVDPVEVDQIGGYHQDELEISLVLDAGEWAELVLFLEKTGSKYVEFDHDEIRQQYPLTKILELPVCSDDQHENPDMSTLRIESRYRELLPIDFDAAISMTLTSIL